MKGQHMTTSSMRYRVFLNVENPHGNAAEALQQMLRTAIAAETSGFDELWLAEHHHSAFATGSAPMVLLSHLAARTSRVRLGTGASLLALNDPVRVGEDVATLDVFSGGRIEFGVARGGPFPLQYRHAGVPSAEVARDRMHGSSVCDRTLLPLRAGSRAGPGTRAGCGARVPAADGRALRRRRHAADVRA